jgi:hypothetical protein
MEFNAAGLGASGVDQAIRRHARMAFQAGRSLLRPDHKRLDKVAAVHVLLPKRPDRDDRMPALVSLPTAFLFVLRFRFFVRLSFGCSSRSRTHIAMRFGDFQVTTAAYRLDPPRAIRE